MKKLRNIKPGRDGIWQVLRHLKKTTVPEIHQMTGIDKRTIQSYLQQLVAGGFLSCVEGRSQIAAVYALVRDSGHHRPVLDDDGRQRPPSSNQRMWMALPTFGQPFSALDLSMAATVRDNTAKAYLIALHRAKFVALHRPGCSGLRALYRYIPANRTGPKAPMIRRDKSVYDQNTHKVVWRPEVAA